MSIQVSFPHSFNFKCNDLNNMLVAIWILQMLNMNLLVIEIACFYVKMNYGFGMIALYSSMNVGVKDTWLAIDGGVPHLGYYWILEFVLSDRGLGVAHPFVFASHVGATWCGHHVCPWRFVVLIWTSMLNDDFYTVLPALGILTRPFGLTHVFKILILFRQTGSRGFGKG